MPKNLSDAQKEHRVTICYGLWKNLETGSNLSDRVITGDESWIFEYNRETKRQSVELQTQLAHKSKSKVNSSPLTLNVGPQRACACQASSE